MVECYKEMRADLVLRAPVYQRVEGFVSWSRVLVFWFWISGVLSGWSGATGVTVRGEERQGSGGGL